MDRQSAVEVVMVRLLGWMVMVLGLQVSLAVAQTLPDPVEPFVNDFAGVLGAADAEAVRQDLSRLKADTGVEMTVVTLGSRSDHGGAATVEGFAQDLFNRWGIGRAAYNDGILVLLVTDERAVRLQLGSGYDQGYDVIAQDIVSRWFLPELRAGRMGGAVREGTRQIVERIALRHAEGLPPGALPSNDGWSGRDLMSLAIGAGVVGFMLFAAFRKRIEGWRLGRRPCPSCGRRGLQRERRAGSAGPIVTRCDRCDWREERPAVTRTNGRRGGGGGSFGGGKSSGGGATGRW